MIEVEKKFQPTEEQLAKMLEGAEFLGEKILNDIYYDYPDYRFLKKEIFLRNRNGFFELKIKKRSGVNEEIEDVKEIVKFLGTDKELNGYVKDFMIVVMEFSNDRESYRKDGFQIDLDHMSFGDECCEIELMVNDNEKTEEAEQRIIDFARQFGIEEKKYQKRVSYLKKFKPDVYEQVYGNK